MLDNVNIEILKLLQKNSRMSASEIATAVGLSVPAAAERLKRLSESKYVQNYTAVLVPKNLGYDVTAFIVVDCTSSDLYDHVVERSAQSNNVLECHSITGEGSHLLKIRAKNSDDLEKQLSKIQSWSGVVRTHTMFVLSTYKETAEIDLEHLISKD
jgi:Lrp/AsnC family leucine-responsive transcriptional regulator